ncbi:MAG: C_GCAxxG_C_C family protein [Deltaproteobacteria bacterium]|nr:C_GCAxxG_C_C family protein [Deltaproteobacteria bacterium]
MNDSVITPVDVPVFIGERAQNLFRSRQMYCSEAVLVVLNNVLGGGLTENQASALAAPFAEGVGKNGCLCGALAGALLAVGLFLGSSNPVGRRKPVQVASGILMKRFKLRFGASCCRILSRKDQGDPVPVFDRCAQQTAEAAAMAASLIMEHRPEVKQHADIDYLNARDSVVSGFFKNSLRRTGCRI